MKYETGKHPVILLIDETANDSRFIKRWLEKNEFLTSQAADILQALEEISDFTVRQCPDVILLETQSLSQDYIREVFQNSYGTHDVSIIAFSKSTGTGDFTDSLAQLKLRLNRALPRMSHAA